MARRAAVRCSSIGATGIAVIHARVALADDVLSMGAAGGPTIDDTADALSAVVSCGVAVLGLLCAMSGVARSNTAIAVVTLRKRDM
jgi:hypothetical protein